MCSCIPCQSTFSWCWIHTYSYSDSSHSTSVISSNFSFCGSMDRTSCNDVSAHEFSGTPGPKNKSSRKRNVPVLIHTGHYTTTYTHCKMHIDWNVSIQGDCVSGTIHFGDRGSQKIRKGTHRFRTSCPPSNPSMCALLRQQGEVGSRTQPLYY